MNVAPNLNHLGDLLYSLQNTAVVVPYGKRSLPGWVPTENQCHGNVDYWVLNNLGSKSVRGWLYFDFRPVLCFVKFTAHSIVQDENGALVDPTPSRASQQYPFIRHPGTDDEFIELVEKYQVTNFDYPI
jgi:hypothetical protein